MKHYTPSSAGNAGSGFPEVVPLSNFSHIEDRENPVLHWNVVVLLEAIEELRIGYL